MQQQPQTNLGPETEKTETTAAKIDQVTAIQDAVDALSLSIFEALRGLRDAAAPEESTSSGGVGAQQQQNATAPGAGPNADDGDNDDDAANVAANRRGQSAAERLASFTDFDEYLLLTQGASSGSGGGGNGGGAGDSSSGGGGGSAEAYARILASTERQRDVELVTRLASTVLEKSAEVDRLVSELPRRTKAEQMDRVEELLGQHRELMEELEGARREAMVKREDVRAALRGVTCQALGIEEEGR